MLRNIALCIVLSWFSSSFFQLSNAEYPSLASLNNTIIRIAEPDPVALDCNLERPTLHLPTATFVWYKENAPLVGNSKFGVTPTSMGSTLRGSNLSQADAGWYTCRVTNTDGYDYRDFLVVIGKRPIVKSQPAGQATVPDIYIPFACDISGTPSPSLVWKSGSTTIPPCNGSNTEQACVDSSDFQLLLKLGSFTMNKNFKCQGSNEFGMAQTDDVQIMRATGVLSQLPGSKMVLLVTTESNEVTTLVCFAMTMNGPSISWLYNGKQVDNDAGMRTRDVQNQMGVHCCRVHAADSSLAATYCTYVLVRIKPTIDISAQGVIGIDSRRNVPVLCTATGNTDPQVKFTLNGMTLTSSSQIQVTSESDAYKLGYLVLTSVSSDNNGRYVCEAFNFIGNISSTFNLTVFDAYISPDNYLSNPGLESGMPGAWVGVNRGDRTRVAVEMVDSEKVAVLSYELSSQASMAYFIQNFSIPSNVVSVRLVGRMRKDPRMTGNSPALMTLTVDGSDLSACKWASAPQNSWMWNSCDITLPQAMAGNNYAAALSLQFEPGTLESSSGVLFDDIAILPLSMESTISTALPTASPGLTLPIDLIIIIGAAGGGGLVLLLVVILLAACVCCCCCCRRGKKSGTETMQKGSMRRGTDNISGVKYSKKSSQRSAAGERQYASLKMQDPTTVYAGLTGDSQQYATIPSLKVDPDYETLEESMIKVKDDYDYISAPASYPAPRPSRGSQTNLLESHNRQVPKTSVGSIQSVDFETGSKQPDPAPSYVVVVSNPLSSPVENPEDFYVIDDPNEELPPAAARKPRLVHQPTSGDSYVDMVTFNKACT